MTFATSAARPSSRSGSPSRTPTVLGTRSTPAAAAGVPRPDEQNRPLGELCRRAVLARVHLHDARIELLCEVGHDRRAVVAGRDDDAVGDEAPLTAGDDVTAALSVEAVDARAEADRELEALRVGLEVVRRLARGGERPARCREAPAGQPVVARRGEEAQRVPGSRPPRAADAVVPVEDHERATVFLQV